MAATVLTNPTTFDQSVTISAGSTRASPVEDVVVTRRRTRRAGDEGLRRTLARVMLISDPSSAVRAVDAAQPGDGRDPRTRQPADSLVLNRVGKDKRVETGDTIITAGSPGGGELPSLFPRDILIGTVTSAEQNDTDIFKHIQVEPFVDLGSLQSVLVLSRSSRSGAVIFDSLKAFALLFVAVLVQVSMLSAYTPLGGSLDLVLVTLVSIALLRGSVFGATAGFVAGLLIDTANLGTLGFTSLLLTLAGFWIGRYGETTARDRFHAPYTSVAVVTLLYTFGALALRFVLGDPAPAGDVALGAAGDGAAQPAADAGRSTRSSAACSRRASWPTAIHEVRLLG